MAIGTLGTNSTTSLAAVTFNPNGPTTSSVANTLSAADLAAMAQSFAGDERFAATNPSGILTTGSTHGTTTLDTLVGVAGGLLATIQIGALVLAAPNQIAPGTFVIAKPSSTSVLLSQAAVGTATGVRIGFINMPYGSGRLSFEGKLELPGGRGLVIVKPGDVVALDNTGWPIVVSAASIGYAGSLWHKV